ncbi:MAG: hypothetical protein D3910_13465 [Candidatus Electrothrix sp. ATG2]|nr:hypothetical protein [Candidatus Electrothrix sp. ATG2]
MSETDFLGIVQKGEFTILEPDPGPIPWTVQLTDMPMQGSVPPDVRKIDLTPYEGQALMVRGHNDSGWIYSAKVIDQAKPILTAVVKQLFHKRQGEN